MAKVNAKSWSNSVESKCQLAFSTEVCMIIIQAQSLNNYTAVENNPIIQKYFSKCAVCIYSANQPTISAPFQKAIIQQINPQSILTLEQLQLRQNLAAHQFLPQLLDQTLVNLFSNGLVFFHLKLDYPRTDCKNTALSLPQKTEVMEPQASCFLLGRVGLVGLAGSGLGCGSFQTGLLTSSLTFSMAFWKRERRSKLESIAPFLTILGTSSSFLLSLRDYQLLFRTNCTFRSLLVLGSLQGYQFFSSYCALLSSQRSSWSSLFTYDSWQILGFFDWILPVGSLQLLGAFLSSLIACVQKALGTLCLALFLAGRSSLQLFIQIQAKRQRRSPNTRHHVPSSPHPPNPNCLGRQEQSIIFKKADGQLKMRLLMKIE